MGFKEGGNIYAHEVDENATLANRSRRFSFIGTAK